MTTISPTSQTTTDAAPNCPACNGSGETTNGWECSPCGGSGTTTYCGDCGRTIVGGECANCDNE